MVRAAWTSEPRDHNHNRRACGSIKNTHVSTKGNRQFIFPLANTATVNSTNERGGRTEGGFLSRISHPSSTHAARAFRASINHPTGNAVHVYAERFSRVEVNIQPGTPRHRRERSEANTTGRNRKTAWAAAREGSAGLRWFALTKSLRFSDWPRCYRAFLEKARILPRVHCNIIAIIKAIWVTPHQLDLCLQFKILIGNTNQPSHSTPS